MYVYSSPSLAVLLPVCCQITLDLLWLQNKLIGIALHQWIMMTNKTEKSKVNIHFKSMEYFKAVEQMLHQGLLTFGPRNSAPNPVYSGPAFSHIRFTHSTYSLYKSTTK